MAKNWQSGSVLPWWNLEHRSLEYVHEPFNCAEDLARWRSAGFSQERFTGDLYDMRFAEPEWIDLFRRVFLLRHFCWSVYRMQPGDVLPTHSDTYHRFCRIYGIDDISRIRRYVVFLEPWQSGHYLEIDGEPQTNWNAGFWVSWYGDTPHLAANMGFQPRYTLQLTGVDIDG
jgi:hypothetical protein